MRRDGPNARGHPGGGIENQHVIARVARWRTEAKLRDGQQKQQQAHQLQQQRPGLLQFAPMLEHRRLLGGGEEAQRRDGVVLPHAVQQVQSHDHARERSENRQKLGQRQD